MNRSAQSNSDKIFCTDGDISNELQIIVQKISALEQELTALITKRDYLMQFSHKEITSKQGSLEQTPVKLSVNQKIELFKKLFKGRSDVFAKRWQNSTGRSGYSFACQNE